MSDPFIYGARRVFLDGVGIQATVVDLAVFYKADDAVAYQRLGEQIDAWNDVREVSADGYARKSPDGR